MEDAPKGRFTFRFAAVCFGLSAVSELFALSDNTILFGVLVGGIGAAAYHLLYIALFAWLTVGLWTGKRSGYHALIITTVVYTIDRLQLLFVGNGLEKSIHQELAGHEEILSAINMGQLMPMLTITILVIVLCWWAFVAYAYVRRGYFGFR
jgi:hypothetical protein